MPENNMNKKFYSVFTLFIAFYMVATAQTPNLYVIEAASSLLGDDKMPIVKYFKDDKMHPNNEGYKVWAEPIRKALPE